MATAEEPGEEVSQSQEVLPQEENDSQGANSPQEDEGLFIPNFLEEAIPDDPVLQVKVARALRAQEMNSRRCWTCNRTGHLARDHQKWVGKNGTGPLQLKGLPPNKIQAKPPQPNQPGPPAK